MARSPLRDDAYQAYVRNLVPDLEWHEVEGVSPFARLDAPEEFETEVKRFLGRIGFPPGALPDQMKYRR